MAGFSPLDVSLGSFFLACLLSVHYNVITSLDMLLLHYHTFSFSQLRDCSLSRPTSCDLINAYHESHDPSERVRKVNGRSPILRQTSWTKIGKSVRIVDVSFKTQRSLCDLVMRWKKYSEVLFFFSKCSNTTPRNTLLQVKVKALYRMAYFIIIYRPIIILNYYYWCINMLLIKLILIPPGDQQSLIDKIISVLLVY